MIAGRTVVGLITARSGSKGLPRKNVLPLAGKPLVVWTVEAARQSRHIDRLVLSSDDREIARVARDAGCEVPFLRPPELARDETSSIDVILHALDEVRGFDLLVLLQPTSPLRVAADIDACVTRCGEGNHPACISVARVERPLKPVYVLDADHSIQPLRPDALAVQPDSFERKTLVHPNGAVYVADVDWLRLNRSFVAPGAVGYLMPPERSIDIDTPLDFMLAESLMTTRGQA